MVKFWILVVFLFLNSNIFGQSTWSRFMPDSYVILDSVSGFINEDAHKDWVVVLKIATETPDSSSLRPVLVFLSDEMGVLNLYSRNDSVVLCADCGGMLGDPYLGVELDQQVITFSFYGGANERWTRTIRFQYLPEKNEIVLKNDEGLDFWATDPDNQRAYTSNPEDFGKLLFRDFSNTKSWESDE